MSSEAPKVHLSRRYRFAASHRLYSESFSDEKNFEVFGKCANPNGHGHNYELWVTVEGEVDPVTGMVTDLDGLDDVVRRHVLERYDHRHLNLDTEDFLQSPPTGENIVRRIWELLWGKIPGVKLQRLQLVETRDNHFEYYGDEHPA